MLYQLSFWSKYYRLESELLDNYFFTYPLGHLAPFFTYIVVLPFIHFIEYKGLVVLPRLSVNSPIFGIKVMRAQSIDLLPKMPPAMILSLAWAGNHLDCSGANSEPHFQI